MSFDPNFNCGQASGDFMSSGSFLDFQGLADNEDSIDIGNLIVEGSENGDENDLFKTLFPESSFHDTPEFKKEDITDYQIGGGHTGIYDKDPELIDQYLQSEASSLCVSACSSVANSPIPFQHPIFQTPPVTPPVDEKSLLRQHLQINVPHQTAQPPPSNMSTNQYSVQAEMDTIQQRYDNQQTHGMGMGLDLQMTHTMQEPSTNQVQQQRSTAANNEPQKVNYIKQESQQNDMDMPLALTIDRTKQPLSSNLNMSNKRSSVSQSDSEPRNKKVKAVAKGTPEYIQKRERNNVAVRRSRDKAKRKALETQEKVQTLTSENKMLREQVKSLNNEVKTLKSLLQNISPFPNLKT